MAMKQKQADRLIMNIFFYGENDNLINDFKEILNIYFDSYDFHYNVKYLNLTEEDIEINHYIAEEQLRWECKFSLEAINFTAKRLCPSL